MTWDEITSFFTQPFIVACSNRSLRVLNTDTGDDALKDYVDGDIFDVRLSTPSTDGPWMFVVETQKVFEVFKERADSQWDTKSLPCTDYTSRTPRPLDVACSPNGASLLLMGSGRGDWVKKLFLLDWASDDDVVALPIGFDDNIQTVAWSCNNVIAFGGWKSPRIYSLHRSTTPCFSLHRLRLDGDEGRGAKRLAFSPDGTWLAAYCSEGQAVYVYIYDVQQGAYLRMVQASASAYKTPHLGFSSDGAYIHINCGRDIRYFETIDSYASRSLSADIGHRVSNRGDFYTLDEDKRWVLNRDRERMYRIPSTLEAVQLIFDAHKVAIWDKSNRIYVLDMKPQ